MELEWDEAKRLINLAKHRLDFLDAYIVFDAPHVETPARQLADESRLLITGLLDAVYVTIIVTRRGNRVRVISTRRARKNERAGYQAIYDSPVA